MTVIGDANTLLSWAATTMAGDGVATGGLPALLPVARVQDLPAVVPVLQGIYTTVWAAYVPVTWDAVWATAQDQVWASLPVTDLTTVLSDTRGKTLVKRLVSLVALARCRALAGG